MTNQQIHLLTTIVLMAAVVILLWRGCEQREKLIETETLHEAANDSLRVSNDGLTATIRVMSTERTKDFVNMATKDTTIKKLQVLVKDYKGKLDAAAIVTTSTGDQGSSSTTITNSETVIRVVGDTVYIETSPTYATDWIDDWSIGEIIANKDTIYRSIWVKNEFEITIGKQRKYNPFKKREIEIQLKNKNPNAVIKDMRAYTRTISDKRWGLCAYAGYGMTATFDGNVYHGVQVGVGVSWRIYP